MREPFRLFAVAVQFMTRFPVPAIRVEEGDLRRASMFFPLIGVLVAGAGIAVRAAAGWLWGPGVGTVAAVLAMVAVTGAFHEDGLADTADGVWGGWSPAQRLRIMRDSRLGTYGSVALFGVLALRLALLAPLPLDRFAATVLIGHVTGRSAGLALAALLPAARDQGHGAKATGLPPGAGVVVAAATLAAVLALCAGRWAWAPLLAAALGVLAVRRLARRRLNGLTGDVLGAVNQVAHVLAMAAMVALWRWGLW